jgi:hypothetical protein
VTKSLNILLVLCFAFHLASPCLYSKTSCLEVFEALTVGAVRGGTFPVPQIADAFVRFLTSPNPVQQTEMVKTLINKMKETYPEKSFAHVEIEKLTHDKLKDLCRKNPLTDKASVLAMELLKVRPFRDKDLIKKGAALFSWLTLMVVGFDSGAPVDNMDQESPDFDELPANETMVFFDVLEDSFLNSWLLKPMVKERYEAAIKNPKIKGKVLFIPVNHSWEVLSRLSRLKETGANVSRVEIVSHGRPGELIGISRSGKVKVEDLLENVTGLFAPKTQIRFICCNLGLGENARSSLKRFSRMHLNKGDKVIVSRNQLKPNDSWVDHIAPGLTLMGGAFRALIYGESGLTWRWDSPKNQIIVIQE